MSAETPRPNNEVLKPVDFYNPITDRVKTLEKLTALPKKELTDVELFEAIADTFATKATIDFEAEEVSLGGFRALDWQRTDEVDFVDKEFGLVFIGYSQQPQDGDIDRDETSWIVTAGDSSIEFQRDSGGSVKVIEKTWPNDVDEHLEEYVMPQGERRKIIEALSEVVKPKSLPL